MGDTRRPLRARIRRFGQRLRAHPAPVKLVLTRPLIRAGWLSKHFIIRHPMGFSMRFFPTSLSAALWADPGCRRHDERVLGAALRAGDTYVDVGANVGSLALAAATIVGASGHVLAIEAHPRTVSYLRRNVELNEFHQVSVLSTGVGAEVGNANISDRHSDDQNSLSDEGIRISVRPLDMIAPAGRIDLLKIDVEGFELQVLRGAREALKRTLTVYCELSGSSCAQFGYEPTAIEDCLLDAGFVLLHQHGERWEAHGEPAYNASDDLRFDPTGYNFIATRPREAEALVSRLNR